MNQELEFLEVESYLDPETFEPLVKIEFNGKKLLITSTAATQKAIAIINAAAYAESEGALFKALAPDIPKGFGKPSKDVQMAVAVLKLVREKRQPLPVDVNAIFGFNTQKPLIQIDYQEFKTTLHLDEARNHAAVLLQASEAARFDAFWFKFGKELNMTEGEIQAVINEYRVYKERYSVEALFRL
ncbi:hypothetical protein [Nostoc sp. TCL240-02]|uniref:hypothetical protein n=1 Tax=Nostoc sp. TCL240-02 TaxID=2572090 RepID=UPI00157F8F5E|nr:hypothetical protein [Nostoc sp. TCL240-02]QKQ75653.1 hypothetical protein FBB35_22260 [Nostoc sp. TCL240-02]